MADENENFVDRPKLIAESAKHLNADEQRKTLPVVTPCSQIDCEQSRAIDRENEGLVRLECTNCRDSGICLMEGGFYE